MAVAALILAAGHGTRMRSSTPKVLHDCAGQPLVAHVVQLALARKCNPIVVIVDPVRGPAIREALSAAFPSAPLKYAVQKEQLGTGHAAKVGLDEVPDRVSKTLILCGDVPLLRPQTVKRLESAVKKADLAFLSADLADPAAYGRVVREGGKAAAIVEYKDASAEQRAITEINVGVYLGSTKLLREAVAGLSSKNAQNEFYLTDAVALAHARGGAKAVLLADPAEGQGVNTQADLAEVSGQMRQRIVAGHMDRGVRFVDPRSVLIDGTVKIEQDVTIGTGVQLYGTTRVGKGASIEGPTVVRDAVLGPGAQVFAFSHIQEAKVGSAARVGPYARLRPNANLGEGARVGNFVEIKNTHMGKGAKANHLSYLGDAKVGPEANVGAGTITCNYDGGPVKHHTEVGKGAFVGSNSTLVAPVRISDGAFVAAGSTLTKDVPKDGLALGRSQQTNKSGYAKKLRERIHRKAK